MSRNRNPYTAGSLARALKIHGIPFKVYVKDGGPVNPEITTVPLHRLEWVVDSVALGPTYLSSAETYGVCIGAAEIKRRGEEIER